MAAAYHRQRKEAERRANGVRPRAEWLAANSDSANKWWEVMGMSRPTWQRRGKPVPETEQEPSPQRVNLSQPVRQQRQLIL